MDPESITDFLTAFTPVFSTAYFALVLALEAGGPGAIGWVYGVLLATACCFLYAD